MNGITLALNDAVELTELLQFVDTWLANDPEHLNESLHRYVGVSSYDATQIRTTLARFIFLLGGDTEGDLFQPPTTTA
jgi:hypothetical protein